MLALPGSAYLYQGEELGLPEHTTMPDEVRQDPTWFRSGHAERGRDGCRVPIPWEADAPSYGFGPTDAQLAAAAGELGRVRPGPPARRARLDLRAVPDGAAAAARARARRRPP